MKRDSCFNFTSPVISTPFFFLFHCFKYSLFFFHSCEGADSTYWNRKKKGKKREFKPRKRSSVLHFESHPDLSGCFAFDSRGNISCDITDLGRGKRWTRFCFSFLFLFIPESSCEDCLPLLCTVCVFSVWIELQWYAQTLSLLSTVWEQIQASGVHEEEGWLLGCIFLRLQSSLIPASLCSLTDTHPLTRLGPGTYTPSTQTRTGG